MPPSWKSQTLHVIDFEGSSSYGIIEFGVVTLQGGEVAGCQTALCQAEGVITERDSWQHGLRREDTAGEPPFATHWERFNGLRQSGHFAAHHASVEERLLKRTWPYPTLGEGERRPGWGPWVDTRVLYHSIFPDLQSHKLASLIDVFGLQSRLECLARAHCPPRRSRYHCALYDALASALLILHLGEAEGFAEMTLDWMLLQSQPRGGKDAAQGQLF